YPVLRQIMLKYGFTEQELAVMEEQARHTALQDFEQARNAEDPKPEDLFTHAYAPTPVTEERGNRQPADGEVKVMVDCALYAIRELMEANPACLLYGQDVG
ncbi:MAG: tungsten formylmethanofuran dehydrogenase, partial [Bacteroidota bacterium]